MNANPGSSLGLATAWPELGGLRSWTPRGVSVPRPAFHRKILSRTRKYIYSYKQEIFFIIHQNKIKKFYPFFHPEVNNAQHIFIKGPYPTNGICTVHICWSLQPPRHNLNVINGQLVTHPSANHGPSGQFFSDLMFTTRKLANLNSKVKIK